MPSFGLGLGCIFEKIRDLAGSGFHFRKIPGPASEITGLTRSHSVPGQKTRGHEIPGREMSTGAPFQWPI